MFQDIANYPTIGAYTGLGNPYYSQHAGFQGALNPYTAGQITGQQGYLGGVPGYGAIHPQHLQLAAMIAAQQGLPQLAALAQLQNPILGGILQNPLVAHLYAQQLQPQIQGGLTGHQMSPYGQLGNPYTQLGNPYWQQQNPYAQQVNPWAQQGLPLAPQTWVGAGSQIGQQIHPLLAQLAARQLAGPGITGIGLGY
jgi:hypothetical protein